ncbi:MAG: hypothetical protein OEL75_04395, partial [Kiritimatiellaceae bacterium]|nr:hypothetical protein [Kiritimatiellaceae bacterium]
MRIMKLLVIAVAVFGGSIASTFGGHPDIEGGRTVAVTDSWVLDSTLCIGRNSSRNHLKVKDGGSVAGTLITLGVLSGADKNRLTVSGQATSITYDSLTVGHDGSKNTVEIIAGATVSSETGACTIGGGRNHDSKGNSVLVSG